MALPGHATPADWPEIAEGSQAPHVCDGCHASLGQIRATGHVLPCNKRGIHMHHTNVPITDCIYWHEWAREHAAETAADLVMARPAPIETDFSCPRCKAEAGQPCTGKPRGAGFHAPRIDRRNNAANSRGLEADKAYGAAWDAYTRSYDTAAKAKQ